MNPSYKYLNTIGNISEKSFKKLEAIAEFRVYPSRTIVVQVGEIPKRVCFLISGVMRAYVTTESGKVFNKKLYSPISFAGALTAIIENEPSEITYESLTECKVFEVDFAKFRKLCREDFEIGRLYVKILERVFITSEERNLDLLRLNGTQLYKKLQIQIPNIDDLIPQYQIAAYLGITPVQLSRIRKKLSE